MDKSWFFSPESKPSAEAAIPHCNSRKPCSSLQEAQSTSSCPALSCNFDGRSARKKELRSQKSLNELENYEVKGFMDLGFVFRKEELSLEIMSIIPGLQRLAMDEESGRQEEEEEEQEEEDEEGKGRPYLSEAWSSDERRGFSVISVPVFGTDMKKQLRSWAKEVAASLRRRHHHVSDSHAK